MPVALIRRRASGDEVRQWARKVGYEVGERGRFSRELVDAFNDVHRSKGLEYVMRKSTDESRVARRVLNVERRVVEINGKVDRMLQALGDLL